MKATIKLVSLTLVGTRKNYCIKFKDGFNLISGHTSTGKTSILEMIDYALGAKSHKSYIEIGNACSHVELVLYIGQEKYRIRRQLFDFKVPALVEDWNSEKQRFMFYNRFEIDSPSNPKSLSAFLIEKIGLANITISGQTFSFRDVFKYCYIKQTEIDNEDIMGEKSWEKNFKRKATFEILFNIYDKTLEEFRSSLEAKKDEAKELEIRLSGVQDFLKSVDIADAKECARKEGEINAEIDGLKLKLSKLKNHAAVDKDASLQLQNEVNSLKTTLASINEEKTNQTQYLDKLRLLYNQYLSEIEKKELAIEGYITFNKFEFLFCPNCLRPINKTDSLDVCCLCGREKSSDASEFLYLKKEISVLRRKSNELLKFTEAEDRRYDEILKRENATKGKLYETELELQHLSKDYINPNLQQIEFINYEIGKKNRLIFELQRDLQMFEEVDRYKQLLDDKKTAIQHLHESIKSLMKNKVDKDELLASLSKQFENILKEFQYPKLSAAYIDERTYLPFVRGRKYDDIGSLAGVSLITMAYYLAILLIGISEDFHHPNLLIIDSPRKNLGAQAPRGEDEEFKDEKIFNATIKYLYEVSENEKNDIQMIVVSNGYPDFIPHECIIAEFDADGTGGLRRGLIDDAV